MKRRVRSSVLFPFLFALGVWAWFTPRIASLPLHHPKAAHTVWLVGTIDAWTIIVLAVCFYVYKAHHWATSSLDRVQLPPHRTTSANDLPRSFRFTMENGLLMKGHVLARSSDAALICFSQSMKVKQYHAWVKKIVDGGELECFLDPDCTQFIPIPVDQYAVSHAFEKCVSA